MNDAELKEVKDSKSDESSNLPVSTESGPNVDSSERKEGSRQRRSNFDDNRKRPRTAKQPSEDGDSKNQLYFSNLQSKRIAKVRSGGRLFRFWVVAVAGDKMGSVGYGVGKALDMAEAKKKAINSAKKSLRYFPMYENRTILHDTEGRSGATSIILRKAKLGTSIIASPRLATLFDLMGIKDIVAKKVKGPSNVINSIEAVFKALDNTARTQFFKELESGKI